MYIHHICIISGCDKIHVYHTDQKAKEMNKKLILTQSQKCTYLNDDYLKAIPFVLCDIEEILCRTKCST